MESNEVQYWVQVTAGKGPNECARAVYRIAEKIMQEATESGIKYELIDSVPGEFPQTYFSALLEIKGKQDVVDSFLQNWKGTIQWICKSPFRPLHKRKNWFVGVNVFPILSQALSLCEKEVVFESMRSQGAGGQHVNTTDSCIRAIHLPTHTTVIAQDHRSQSANKKLALKRLAFALEEQHQMKKETERREQWKKHGELERGNPIKIFVGEKEGRQGFLQK